MEAARHADGDTLLKALNETAEGPPDTSGAISPGGGGGRGRMVGLSHSLVPS